MSGEIFDTLRQLALPRGDYAVFGSGPLIVRGLVPFANDLDVLCRGRAWAAARRAGRLRYLPDYDQHVVTLAKGRISLGTAWGIGDFDTDELIDSAEIIDGLPFVPLRFVIRYKEIRASPKDRAHLEAIRAAGLCGAE